METIGDLHLTVETCKAWMKYFVVVINIFALKLIFLQYKLSRGIAVFRMGSISNESKVSYSSEVFFFNLQFNTR